MRANPTACILGGSGLDVVTGGFTAFALNQAGFGTAVTVQTVPSSVTLANGTNNDIAVAASFIKIAGPTGAFAITGFIGPLVPGGPGHSGDGMILRVYNTTAQQMTITNLATSSADRQIRTLTGADVVLRAGTSYATFTYDNADVSGSGKWILTATN
jgi:hypothetical protein